jgi:paraquat-inducible protein B
VFRFFLTRTFKLQEANLKKFHILFVLTVFLLPACEETGLNLKIRFDQIEGLQSDNRVIFDSNDVGRVTRVFYAKEGHYLVDVIIKEDFANAATEDSRFYIIDDPQAAGQKAVEMLQIRKGGAPLADGSTVEGSTQSTAVYQKMLENFEKQTGKLGKQLQQLFDDLRKLPESDEVKQLQKDLEELGQEMEKAGKAARDKIQNEVVPLIKEELERLKKRLENFGREKEVDPLEKQLEKLTTT